MELTGLWSGAVGWLLGLHRQVYLDLGAQMRLLAEGGAAPLAMLALAFLLGVLHALTPGHGKSVIVVYFLGQVARPIAGIAMGLRIATVHVAIGIALFFALRSLLVAFGAGGQAATAGLRLASHAAVALVGLWLLIRAARLRPDVAPRHGALGVAVGLLPCPMTLLLLGYATANATPAAGLMLVGIMALGIGATLGAIGVLAILARHHVATWLGNDDAQVIRGTRPIALASAALVAGLGTAFLLLELLSPQARPFG